MADRPYKAPSYWGFIWTVELIVADDGKQRIEIAAWDWERR